MPARTTPARAKADAAFLERLYAEKVDPVRAMGLLAGRHLGKKGFASFRTTEVAAAKAHFPPASEVTTLVSALWIRTRFLLDECKKPSDELLVGAFFFWGLLAIHPFEDANGRVARDLLQYLFMIRWQRSSPTLHRVETAAKDLVPVLGVLTPPNDGSPDETVKQLRTLVTVFGNVTVAKLRKDKHFTLIGKWLVERLVGA